MQVPAFNTITPIVIVAAFFGLTVPLRGEDGPEVGVVRLNDTPPPKALSSTSAVLDSWGGGPNGGDGWHGGHGRHGRHRTAYPSPLSVWLSKDHEACTYSPAHNWSRPVKYPIRRAPVEYRRYWPDKWYGEPGSGARQSSFPVVAVPTDTTQLGYYYQRVPQWRPNPGMLPTRPWPTMWHRRECPGPMAQSTPRASSFVPTPPAEEPAPAPAPPDAKDLQNSASAEHLGPRR